MRKEYEVKIHNIEDYRKYKKLLKKFRFYGSVYTKDSGFIADAYESGRIFRRMLRTTIRGNDESMIMAASLSEEGHRELGNYLIDAGLLTAQSEAAGKIKDKNHYQLSPEG